MKQQWVYYYAEILQRTGRLLVLPVLAGCIWITYRTTSGVTFVTREMPVITISKDGTETVVWAGGDMEPVRKNAMKKTEDIVSSLYSNPPDFNYTRDKITGTLRYFPAGSDARNTYKQHAGSAIERSGHTETAFMPSTKHINFLPEHGLWVVEITGTFVATQNQAQTGKKMRISVAYRKTSMSERNATEQALIVDKMEVKQL